MHCSHCGKTIKPVVAIDIDGTMGNYHKHFMDFAEKYTGRMITGAYTGFKPYKQWFKEETGAGDNIWHDIKLAYRQGGQKRSMPVYRGAADLTSAVLASGAELWITTTRPYIRHDNIDPDTREWLSRNGIKYDYLIYDGDKYRKLAAIADPARVVAVVDDLVEELKEAQRLFGVRVPIMRRTVYNSARNWDPDYDTLYDIEQEVVKRVLEWKEHYGNQA